MGLDGSIMAYIGCYNFTQSIFIVLETLCISYSTLPCHSRQPLTFLFSKYVNYVEHSCIQYAAFSNWLLSCSNMHLFPSYLFMSWCFAVLSCFSHATESLSPLDYDPPGFSVHENVQARILEGVAMLCSRGSFWPRDRAHVSCVSCIAGRFFIAEAPGKLIYFLVLNNISLSG